MKKYDNYKDSGIEWIGDVPEHWEVNKFGRAMFFQEGPGLRNWQFTESGIKVICVTNIVPPNIDFSKMTKYISKEEYESTYKHFTVNKGDVMLASSGASWGKVAEYTDDEIVILNTSTIRINEGENNKVKKDFIKWIIQSPYINESINLLLTGSCQPNFGPTHLNKLTCVYPSSIEEQKLIANYLDHKTTQIDTLITKKEQFISLLQEERTAVINQAVTKGLDPNVPMKDSGIEWLGEIPENWEMWKISHAFKRIGSGTTPESGNPLYHENGTINWLNTGDLNDGILNSCNKKVTAKALEDFSSLKIFPAGSLVMAMYGATIGKTSIINFDTTTNQACCVFCKGEIIDVKFLQYWFIGNKEHIINLAIGGGQPNISQNILKDVRVCCPNFNEQTTIAHYLDHKTTQIDTLIFKKQQFITLLQEERTAVINQAVTKGLDPNVPMKDSGIEWLGEIPEHWEVKKLKYLLKENKDSLKTGPFGSHIKNSDYIPNGNYKVYTQRNVLDNEYENGCESISEEKFDELKGFTIYEGDFLITTRGSIGRCSVFPENMPTGILHPCLIRIQINENLSLRNWIVNYINNTSLFYNNVKFNSNSTIIDVIYGYTLKEIFFPTPSIIEQKKILEFLEVKINEIDTIISKSQQEIELLKEYKTALISEVVTGKVDVRDVILN